MTKIEKCTCSPKFGTSSTQAAIAAYSHQTQVLNLFMSDCGLVYLLYLMFSTQQQNQPRTIDISLLQDYRVNTRQDWTRWEFDEQEYESLPLGFNNRYNLHKNIKFCDLSALQQSQEEADFLIVEENIKKKNKDFISKNLKMNENRQSGNPFRRIFNKRMQRNPKQYTTQIKTNFKKISVKNNWTQVKNITKNNLEGVGDLKNLKVENLKTIGNLHLINQDVDRINWEETRFKENKVYTVDPVKTADDQFLTEIAIKLTEEETTDRFNIICNPTFLLALLTVRAGVYPWNIEIEKMGNNIVLENFKNNEDESEKLTYLDLFTINQNTSNNMIPEESKLKEVCISATKMTKVFQDLLASGDQIDKEDILSQFPQESADNEDEANQNEDEEEQEEEDQESSEKEELSKIRKYLKISFDKVDIYTYVEVDGAKRNSTTGELQFLLIRTFMESESQGVWVKSMKTPGALITKEYQSNSCSIQKWICEARLAGVEELKTGFIGFSQNKSLALLNVEQVSVKGLENTLSFKYESCWGVVKYICNLLMGLEDGQYVLAKNPYTPLSIKLYQTSSIEEEAEYEEDENNGENAEDAAK